jgi:hypothetical protein
MNEKMVPIYTSRGDAEAFMQFPYLFNRNGEWIGFVNSQREVFSVLGHYVGKITDDPRIIRRRSDESRARLQPPHKPGNLRISATIALPRMMSDLSQEFIDVLQEDPELLHTLDAGDLRPDMD